MTDLQQTICDALVRFPNKQGTLAEIAEAIGRKRIAVAAALRGLLKQNIADYFRSSPEDQWSVQIWFLVNPARREPIPVKEITDMARKEIVKMMQGAVRVQAPKCAWSPLNVERHTAGIYWFALLDVYGSVLTTSAKCK